MQTHDLDDAQWCFLDLCMRAREKGVARINRHELLSSPTLPDAAKVKLTFAGLTMPRDLVTMIGEHDFQITDAGVSLYKLRFGSKPTAIADVLICLPDRSAELLN